MLTYVAVGRAFDGVVWVGGVGKGFAEGIGEVGVDKRACSTKSRTL